MTREAQQHTPDRSFLFDGYPRSRHQAMLLDDQLAALGTQLHLFILLEVDSKTIHKRLTQRRTIEGRDDDTLDKINHRLQLYHTYSPPIINHYPSNIIVRINGDNPPDVVTEQIIRAINACR